MAIKQITYSDIPRITRGEADDPEGWDFNEHTGEYSKFDPNYQAPSRFSLDDLKNRSGFALNPGGELVSYSSDETPTDPNEYYRQLGLELAKLSYEPVASGYSGYSEPYDELIENLKEIDPKAYYTSKINLLSRYVGHHSVIGDSPRLEENRRQLQELLPVAQQAGVTADQINNAYQGGFSSGGQYGSQVLTAQKGSGGGFFAPLIEGLKFVGPGLLGMYGIDAALGAALGAGYGAGTGMATYGIGSGLGGAAALEGGALAGAGSLGSGALGAGAIASDAGQAAFFDALANGATSAEALNAGLSLEALASNTAPYVTSELAGPTYAEMGYTGVEGGFAGPTYGEMGYTGLNTEAAITAADAAAAQAAAAEAASGLLSNAGNILKGAQVAKGLLGVGKNPLQPGSQPQPQMQMQGGRQYAGVDYAPILNLLNIQQPQRNRNSLLG